MSVSLALFSEQSVEHRRADVSSASVMWDLAEAEIAGLEAFSLQKGDGVL
jgi:hypothetical protein